MEKILTVSIAAYNVEKYLGKALISLLSEKKDLDKLQILVIDDGSSDHTYSIADQFAKQYPNTIEIIKKDNGGYGSTINAALKLAEGKYFKLLDGDDWYDNANLHKFINYLENASSDLVLSPYTRVYESGKKPDYVNRHDICIGKKFMIRELDYDLVSDIHAAELTVQTQLLKNIKLKITEKCFYTDNEYVFLPFLHAKSIEKFGDNLYCYRIGNENQSVSVAGRIKHNQDCEKVIYRMALEMEKERNVLSKTICSCAEDMIVNLIVYQYGTYLLCDATSGVIENLKQYDKKIRLLGKSIYRATARKNIEIIVLRVSKFRMFKILHFIKLKKLGRL